MAPAEPGRNRQYTRPVTEIKPAYLIAGTDEGEDRPDPGAPARARGARGGAGRIELFEAGEGRRAPDAEALLSSLAAIALISSRRYLLVNGVDAWGKKDTEQVVKALADLPPDTTVALIARGKPPAALKKAVEGAGGELLLFDSPKEREMPKHLVGEPRSLASIWLRTRRGCSWTGSARAPCACAPSSSGSPSGRVRRARRHRRA